MLGITQVEDWVGGWRKAANAPVAWFGPCRLVRFDEVSREFNRDDSPTEKGDRVKLIAELLKPANRNRVRSFFWKD